ncbi:MAG TPA: GntR family transcriptional regulator [Streptosporangiaceae bacterium]
MTVSPASRPYGIADELETELRDVPVGARMPSEHVLAARFAVNRSTARAALGELERRSVVRRVPGFGTFRRGPLTYVVGPHTPPSFSVGVRRGGGRPGHRLVTCVPRRAVALEREHLDLGAGAVVWLVERVFLVNGEPAGFATSVLPHRGLPGLDRALADADSLHAVLRRRYGITTTRAVYRLGWADAPARVAHALGSPEDADRGGLWLAESVNRAGGGDRVEYSRTYMRPDILNIVFEMEEPTP